MEPRATRFQVLIHAAALSQQNRQGAPATVGVRLGALRRATRSSECCCRREGRHENEEGEGHVRHAREALRYATGIPQCEFDCGRIQRKAPQCEFAL